MKVKGFRSVSAWLDLDLPHGNLIGIVGPNGGVWLLFVISTVLSSSLLRALALAVPQAVARARS